MFCTNCGKKIPDNSKFCPQCGTVVEDDNNIQENNEMKKIDFSNAQDKAKNIGKDLEKNLNENISKAKNSKIVKDAKNGNKKAIGILAGGAAVIVIFLLLIVTHKPTLDMADYTKIEFTGAQGYGEAQIEFDYNKFTEDVIRVARVDGKKVSTIDLDELIEEGISAELFDTGSKLYNFASYIEEIMDSQTFDHNGNLSNGDEVVCTYTYDNDVLTKYGFKLKGEKIKEKVSGLEKAKEINPFDVVEVTFSEISPNARAKYTVNSDNNSVYDEISYTFDKEEGLTLGDKVVLMADADNTYLAQQYGVVLSETTKEYTVEGVQAYVPSADQIPADLLANMQKQAEDIISSYFASKGENISVSGTTYQGYYFLDSKTYTEWRDQNGIYLIYSGNVKSKEDDGFSKTKVYFPIYFNNLMINADGTGYTELSNKSISGNTDLGFGWFDSVSGYTDKAMMLNDLVTANKGDYETEVVGDDLQ